MEKPPKSHSKRYSTNTVKNVQYVYVVAAILWVVILFAILIYWRGTNEGSLNNGMVGTFILFIPVIAFGISFYNARYITKEQEQGHWNGDYLTFASVAILILVHWSNSLNKERSYRIIMTAFLLLMLSLTEIWTKPKDQPIIKHSRGVFQTAGLTLLAYALYISYAQAENATPASFAPAHPSTGVPTTTTDPIVAMVGGVPVLIDNGSSSA